MWGKTKKVSNPDNISDPTYSLTKIVDELKIQVAHLQISQWYNQYLDRYPLPEETLNWNKDLLNNVSLEIIHNKIINSLEAIKKQKKISNLTISNPIISKTTLDEHTIFLNPNDKVCIETYADVDSYDPGSTAILKKLLKKDMNVINIGANIGYFTLLAAREVGPQGKIFAFEPFPKTVELLQKNVDVNGYSNVDVVPMAVSDKTGTAKLALKPDSTHNFISNDISEYGTIDVPLTLNQRRNFISKYDTIDVPLTTIDEYIKNQKIDFVIMDAEGHEPLILNGMAKTLEKNPHIQIITEYNPYTLEVAGNTGEKFIEIMENLEFNISIVGSENMSKDMIKEKLLNIKYPNTSTLYLRKS
tara:strand:+ start:56 stop:1132 length:1077 start_codon:yes stop_codon:yes gene_type:complete